MNNIILLCFINFILTNDMIHELAIIIFNNYNNYSYQDLCNYLSICLFILFILVALIVLALVVLVLENNSNHFSIIALSTFLWHILAY